MVVGGMGVGDCWIRELGAWVDVFLTGGMESGKTKAFGEL